MPETVLTRLRRHRLGHERQQARLQRKPASACSRSSAPGTARQPMRSEIAGTPPRRGGLRDPILTCRRPLRSSRIYGARRIHQNRVRSRCCRCSRCSSSASRLMLSPTSSPGVCPGFSMPGCSSRRSCVPRSLSRAHPTVPRAVPPPASRRRCVWSRSHRSDPRFRGRSCRPLRPAARGVPVAVAPVRPRPLDRVAVGPGAEVLESAGLHGTRCRIVVSVVVFPSDLRVLHRILPFPRRRFDSPACTSSRTAVSPFPTRYGCIVPQRPVHARDRVAGVRGVQLPWLASDSHSGPTGRRPGRAACSIHVFDVIALLAKTIRPLLSRASVACFRCLGRLRFFVVALRSDHRVPPLVSCVGSGLGCQAVGRRSPRVFRIRFGRPVTRRRVAASACSPIASSAWSLRRRTPLRVRAIGGRADDHRPLLPR